MTTPILEVLDVHQSFGGVKAVNGATFQVLAGEITGLIGPNGAGKSSLCGVVAGALKPEAGRVVFLSTDITGKPSWFVARKGLIRTFQLSGEFAGLTVLENLIAAAPHQRGESVLGAFRGRRFWVGQERELVQEARELLDRVGLLNKEDEYAGNLSGGQKRLLEITRALMCRPRLLLLDEPMAGVHADVASRIADYLMSLATDGLSVLMIEHELALVERLCNRVIVMAQGRVISQGSMSVLRSEKAVQDAYLIG
jgi:branched-chain amino acid transport system permease protein